MAYLASRYADYISGATMRVSGGAIRSVICAESGAASTEDGSVQRIIGRP